MSTDIVEENRCHQTLRGRGEIVEKLRLTQQKRCLLTAYHENSRDSLMTAVIEILPELGLVAFDVSANEALNQRLAKPGRVVLFGKLDGVKIRFAVDGLRASTLGGQPVFTAALPETLCWQQRRQYHRVVPPMNMAVMCKIALQGAWQEFEVCDLSISGLALCDQGQRLDGAIGIGDLLRDCVLKIPQSGELRLALEVRGKAPWVGSQSPGGQRIGCAFRNLGPGAEIHLQKFVFEAELYERRRNNRLRA